MAIAARLLLVVLGLLLAQPRSARSETHYVDLGTQPPPSMVGPVPVLAFDVASQATIPDSQKSTRFLARRYPERSSSAAAPSPN